MLARQKHREKKEKNRQEYLLAKAKTKAAREARKISMAEDALEQKRQAEIKLTRE